MTIPGVHIETVKPPALYTTRQIENACAIAYAIHRGLFVLTEPPKR